MEVTEMSFIFDKIADHPFYTPHMIIIDNATLSSLSQKAATSPRLRQGNNYHAKLTDPLQRMLNAFEPGTYVRPHRHIDQQKREVFIILKGRLLVMFFDDEGLETHRIELSSASGIHAVEIAPDEWHMATALEPGTVVYEIKDGPYDPATDKQFAPWAPEETDAAAATTWLNERLAEG